MTDQAIAPYVQRVQGLLRTSGRAESANQLGNLLEAPAKGKPVVYVAGEVNRGKSSLINALLGRPGLSPVAVDVATAAPITFFGAEPPEARFFRYGSPDGVFVDVDEAIRLATVAGNPGNEENVRAVSVGVPVPLLATLTLVDTPGVGGLASGHGALTLQSLHNADALLFVIEAGAQLRAAELEFLRNASSRIDTVILALTKIDTYRGWRTIRDDNLAILRQRAPRFAACPVVAVSSTLALRGIASDDPQDAADLRSESGFDELEGVLTDVVVERAAVLRDANVTRAGLSALAGIERATREKLSVGTADGEGRHKLQAEQARLRELNQAKADWPQTLDTGIRSLTLDRSEAVTRRTIEIRRRYEERLKDIARKDYDTLPGELIADLTALASELNETASDRLIELVRSLLTDMDDAATLEQKIGGLGQDSMEEELGSLALGHYRISHFEKLSLLNSFSSGRSLASLASGSGLGLTASTLIAPPIGIAVGLGLGALFAVQAFRNRDRQLFLNEFISWMRDQIAQAQTIMNSSFQRATVEIGADIRQSIRAALSAREQEINEALAAGRAMLQAEDGRRQQARRELEERLKQILALRGEARTLLSGLSASPPSPSAPPVARGGQR